MSKFKFTEGPWKLVEEELKREYGELVWTSKGEGYGAICEMRLNNQSKDKANARLISCAPEMLDALIFVIKHDNGNLCGDCRSASIKIIEKATGMSIDEVLK